MGFQTLIRSGARRDFPRLSGRERVAEGTDEIRAGRKKVKANSSREETNRLRLPLALYTHGFFFV